MENDPSSGGVMRMLEEHLAFPSSSWSIGVPGAIAEFHRADDDACELDGSHCVVTGLGSLRLRCRSGLRAHAYEILSARPDRWQHGVVLSLPGDACTMSGRHTISEVGADREAIRPEDRGAVLFDLGLGSPYCDFYVRVSDREHIARLRQAAGTSLLDACCELFDDLVHMSPHRVFVSKLARIEIYQPIGKPGAATPHGPHTHLLPKLFRRDRSHLPGIPLPAGRAPCLTLYPANPVFDGEGLPKPFDRMQYDAFQRLLAAHGEPDDVSVKHAVWEAVRGGVPPGSFTIPSQRRARIACRVALRQLLHGDGASPVLSQWLSAFEPRVSDETAAPSAHPGSGHAVQLTH